MLTPARMRAWLARTIGLIEQDPFTIDISDPAFYLSASDVHDAINEYRASLRAREQLLQREQSELREQLKRCDVLTHVLYEIDQKTVKA